MQEFCGLAQPIISLDVHPAPTTQPEQPARTPTRPAPAPLIHGMITEQQVQDRAGPELDRARCSPADGLNVIAAMRTSRSALSLLWVVPAALSRTTLRFTEVAVCMHLTVGDNTRAREWPA